MAAWVRALAVVGQRCALTLSLHPNPRVFDRRSNPPKIGAPRLGVTATVHSDAVFQPPSKSPL